jgi:hypothetical protein
MFLISQKTAFFIVTAVKTSNLTCIYVHIYIFLILALVRHERPLSSPVRLNTQGSSGRYGELIIYGSTGIRNTISWPFNP